MNKATLLLVEDDVDLGNVIKQYLEICNFEVELCRDGRIAWDTYQQNTYDLCILDVMLPKLDGFSLAEKIHDLHPNQPFIFLTAKDQKVDRLLGLKLGADDYITKPFEIDEMVLRIQNILRRSKGKGRRVVEQKQYTLGSLQFDVDTLTLSKGTETVRLTLQEVKLLEYLVSTKNTVAKREDILKHLWGEDDYFNGRSMDVFISRLRKYLKLDQTVQIETVRGVGFILKY